MKNAISYQRYVNIISGVGGNAAVGTPQLIGRIFTTNPLLPTQSFIEFTSAAQVGAYFGTTSEEYKRAQFYFGWISPNIKSPAKISFARWANVATAPVIYGGSADITLADWTSIADGDLTMTIGADTHHISGLNFSGCASLLDVATVVQDAIRTETGPVWTGATVAYDSARKSFDFTGGATGANALAIVAGTTHDVGAMLGWTEANAIVSDGADAETLTTTLTNSVTASNNFGSFLFVGGSSFTLSQHQEISTWNATQNNAFEYCISVTASNAATMSAGLINLPGNALTLQGPTGEFHSMIPMIIMAATDYTARNATQNYMYKQFAVTPTVKDDLDANTYDALRVNYIGQTQDAGQLLAFYQRGVLTGLAVNPTDQNTYANEVWLKAYCAAKILSLLLSLAKVSANTRGRGQILTVLQDAINQAILNGTISVGKTLNTTQQLFIAQITGSETAWQQVQNNGYWLDVTFQQFVTSDGRTEWKAVYTLVYSKDDVVRSVNGSHVLI